MKIREVKFVKSIVGSQESLFPLEVGKRKKKVFFLGRSNVGKSSLINSLFEQKELAYSSAKAGKTRTINIYRVNNEWDCCDFPGYGYSKGGRENQLKLRDMILDYLSSNLDDVSTVVVVLDAQVGPTELDHDIFSYLLEKEANIVCVLNKVDRVNQKEFHEVKNKVTEELGDIVAIPYSCRKEQYRSLALTSIFGE